MAATKTNYFAILGLKVEEVMNLPEDRRGAKVQQAHDEMLSMYNVRGEQNPRADVLEMALKKLLDPVTRDLHAEDVGYKEREEPAQQEPEHQQGTPDESNRGRPVPRQPQPPPWTPDERRRETPMQHEAGPWWSGVLLAIPAGILYIGAAGLTIGRRGPIIDILDTGAVIIAAVTALLVGFAWWKVLLFGPFIFGALIWVTQFTARGFVRDMTSWNVPPEAAIMAILAAIGVFAGLTGQMRPTTNFTGNYMGTRTARFFLTAMVLIPMIGTMTPTRGTEPGDGPVQPPAAPEPSARTEAGLGLTRNDWREIQAGLETTGHYRSTIDGLVGPRTRTAITEWQRTRSGVATSYLNQTQAAALRALAPAPEPPATAPFDEGRSRADAGRGRESPRTPEPIPEPARTAGVVVTAEPDSRIVLDRRDIGSTDENGLLRIDEVEPGGHVLIAKKAGFDDVRLDINVEEGRSQIVELVARPLPGRLSVTTNVAGARVAIDGREPMPTPLTDFEVESGTRLVTVTAPGYSNHEEHVEVGADRRATHHATLEEMSLDTEMAYVQTLFDDGHYPVAANMADILARMLLDWRELGIDVDENLGVLFAIQGRSLHTTGSFAASIPPLYNAVLLGHTIELPIKHRHGGGGFRQGFCAGVLAYSLDEISFQSTDDPDHGFAVRPQDVTNIESAEAQDGFLSRLNTEVEGRGDMDFVHPNSEQQRRDPDSALITDIVCRDCNQALAVHEQLLQLVTRSTQ